ncbi:MAG: hypothetical protein EA409_02560 [Saprospirales bacterium]|nr:MAG: hypothetical protein EA409_02560 [Saprospirales bacterium]
MEENYEDDEIICVTSFTSIASIDSLPSNGNPDSIENQTNNSEGGTEPEGSDDANTNEPGSEEGETDNEGEQDESNDTSRNENGTLDTLVVEFGDPNCPSGDSIFWPLDSFFLIDTINLNISNTCNIVHLTLSNHDRFEFYDVSSDLQENIAYANGIILIEVGQSARKQIRIIRKFSSNGDTIQPPDTLILHIVYENGDRISSLTSSIPSCDSILPTNASIGKNISAAKGPSSIKYRMQFDLERGEIKYFKKQRKRSFIGRWLCSSKEERELIGRMVCPPRTKSTYKVTNKLRPQTGSLFAISYINPIKDSLPVDYSFKDYFQDDAEQFRTVMGILGPTDSEKDDKIISPVANGHFTSGRIEGERITCIQRINDQLNEYIKNRHEYGIFDQTTLNRQRSYIGTRIKLALGISEISVASLQELFPDGPMPPEAVDLLSLWEEIQRWRIATIPPIQIENKDRFFVHLNQSKAENINNNFTYEFKTSGGLKIDFSTGFIITGLTDKKYYLKSVSRLDTTFFVDNGQPTDSIVGIDTPTLKQINEGNKDDYNFGLGILSHIYVRTGGTFNFALSPGLMLTSNTDVNILLGGSIMASDKSRFVLSGGVALGRVERLRSDLAIGEIWDDSSTSIIPTERVPRKSWFVSLTFNF